ncbi:MAG TPA: ATPase, T2SS/T4P/T4SS family [Motilibacteraceae bacterium]|nr:ATPase, T2SS/T4P/T4SS family [Motilibacteraceae bacterium]
MVTGVAEGHGALVEEPPATRPAAEAPDGAFAPAVAAPRRRLGEVLVDAGLLTPAQLAEALREQQAVAGPRRRLGAVIVSLGLAREVDVAAALATQLGLRLARLDARPPRPEVVRLLPRPVAERSRAVVVHQEPRRLVVASADPTNVVALDDVRVATGCQDLEIIVATESEVRDHLLRAWSEDIRNDPPLARASTLRATTTRPGAAEPTEVGDAPVVRFVEDLLTRALALGASDVHLEPQRDLLRVRFRIDGVLRDITHAQQSLAAAVVSRVKVMAGLDIAERRLPQDGRATLANGETEADARVSTLPSTHGEKVVIRLLQSARDVPAMSALGLEQQQREELHAALSAPQGLVLITGPTGSGKTTTLYSALHAVADPARNVVTLEDPVEVDFRGITQVQVNVKQGLTFARGLRAVLRQDPDVVLVGEVRDAETARLALEASLTGHLVLTTLHTGSAAGALTRLVDMGIEPYLVASSLTLAVAQRLVRTPCRSCSQESWPSGQMLELLGLDERDLAGATPVAGQGCGECSGTGYAGRTALFEVLPVDADLRRTLLASPTEEAVVGHLDANGIRTLRTIALERACQGVTTFEEALRVTHADRRTR